MESALESVDIMVWVGESPPPSHHVSPLLIFSGREKVRPRQHLLKRRGLLGLPSRKFGREEKAGGNAPGIPYEGCKISLSTSNYSEERVSPFIIVRRGRELELMENVDVG
jgi:hypothetical protein